MTQTATATQSLPTTDALNDERRRTAAQLLELANDPRFALRSQDLRDLVATIRAGGPDESRWRGIDLHRAFAPEITIRPLSRWRRRVAIALGVLAAVFLLLTAGRVLSAEAGQLLEIASGAVVLLIWSGLFAVAAAILHLSADYADRIDRDACTARLARAMTAATLTINHRSVRDPLDGVDVLTEATVELLSAQRITQQALQLLVGATQHLEESTEALTQSTMAIGTSLGLHTGALQHQISELTQIRASLVRISGLAAFEQAAPEFAPEVE